MYKVYHTIDNLSGSVITLRAEGVKYRELAEVTSRNGSSLAQVIKLDGPNVTLQVFAGARGGPVPRPPDAGPVLGRAAGPVLYRKRPAP